MRYNKKELLSAVRLLSKYMDRKSTIKESTEALFTPNAIYTYTQSGDIIRAEIKSNGWDIENFSVGIEQLKTILNMHKSPEIQFDFDFKKAVLHAGYHAIPYRFNEGNPLEFGQIGYDSAEEKDWDNVAIIDSNDLKSILNVIQDKEPSGSRTYRSCIMLSSADKMAWVSNGSVCAMCYSNIKQKFDMAIASDLLRNAVSAIGSRHIYIDSFAELLRLRFGAKDKYQVAIYTTDLYNRMDDPGIKAIIDTIGEGIDLVFEKKVAVEAIKELKAGDRLYAKNSKTYFYFNPNDNNIHFDIYQLDDRSIHTCLKFPAKMIGNGIVRAIIKPDTIEQAIASVNFKDIKMRFTNHKKPIALYKNCETNPCAIFIGCTIFDSDPDKEWVAGVNK